MYAFLAFICWMYLESVISIFRVALLFIRFQLRFNATSTIFLHNFSSLPFIPELRYREIRLQLLVSSRDVRILVNDLHRRVYAFKLLMEWGELRRHNEVSAIRFEI